MLAEFERTMALPGMVGAMLAGDGFLSLKRAERFRPILEAADRYGAIMLVHYGKIANDPEPIKVDSSDNGHPRVGTLDMQARLSQNMITFCLTDFLKSFPNVTVLSHNLGGNIPFEIERMDHRTMIDLPPGTELPSKKFRARAGAGRLQLARRARDRARGRSLWRGQDRVRFGRHRLRHGVDPEGDQRRAHERT